MVNPAGYWSQIISLERSMKMKEFPKCLLLPRPGSYSTIITLLITKYIHLDQGGELFNNPDVNNLL